MTEANEQIVHITVIIGDASNSEQVRLRDTSQWTRVMGGERFKCQRRDELSYNVGKAAERALRRCLAANFGAF